MARSRASAKAAGSQFEQLTATHLARGLNDDGIERRVTNGAKDRGDISGLKVRGRRLVIECKNVARMDLAGWLDEAHVEAANDDAAWGVVVHKRRGVAAAGEQYVTLTLDDFMDLVWGTR